MSAQEIAAAQEFAAALDFAGLRRRYGQVVALDGLSFSVPAGEVFGFLGPNGSGKTTAMRAVFGLAHLDAGEVRWQRRPVDRAVSRGFGYMPEERGLYPGMAVATQLHYLGRLHGLSAADAASRTAYWLDRLDVADRADAKVEALSLGNQQRVQLAAALLHEPEVLVLDEPLSGLDPVGIDAVSAILAEQAAAGRAVLFSSHQLDLVEHICSSVAIIDRGRLVSTGKVAELTEQGRRRLAVRVDGDRDGAWARAVAGVTVSRMAEGTAHLQLAELTDPQAVLAAAVRAGPVLDFGIERRRLSEVFRDAVREDAP
jgi:ABC-2 type transport system ATP-binding protein